MSGRDPGVEHVIVDTLGNKEGLELTSRHVSVL